MLKNTKTDNIYVSILADGMLHAPSTEDTEGAVRRDYETSSGEKGTKWEHVYSELTGKISKVAFREGDFGLQLQVTFEDEGNKPIVLSVNTQSNFGEDIMKKLPNVDMEKAVKLVPYSFKDEKGKTKRGVTIYQDEQKIQSFYYDPETKKPLHGYPVAKLPKVKKGEKVPTSFWKLFYLQANAFLVEDLKARLKIEETVDASDSELEEMVEDAAKNLE